MAWFVLALFAALGLGALWGAGYLLLSGPAGAGDWLSILAGIMVGGATTWAIAGIISAGMLHRFRPARLEGDSDQLHVRIWDTWSGGSWSGLRATDVRIPKRAIRRALWSQAQGGQTQLFLEHVSGLSFYTGWMGDHAKACEHGASIAAWCADQRAADHGQPTATPVEGAAVNGTTA